MKQKPFADMTDAQLLDRFYEDGDRQWLGVLLERYTLLLFGVCMKYLKQEEEARDCVQQIFLKVLTDASRHKISFFKSWLYMVAKNESLMRLRNGQGKRIKELQEDHQWMEQPQEKDLLEKEQTFVLLEAAIAELNEEQRTTVSLFYLQKMSYQQISDRTGFTLFQVKSYIQNGKRNLRLLLERKLKNSNL